jgi:Exoribonuclease R
MAPGMEIEMAIRSHELPHRWPDELLEEIKPLKKEVPESAKEGRVDLRKTPLVTIDGEDARDFDDAVYCQKTPKGWKLLVAIADVSHYVQINSELDKEAQKRSTSVYFPEQVIPMLPEILSNGLCSLNPQVDRLCMVCELLINGQGQVTRSRFFDAVMSSHARLTYTEVAKMLVDGDPALTEQYKALMPHLQELYALYKVMRVSREQRGAMDFDTQETKIVFGANRKIEKIVPVVRNDAHKLIEEFMITANMAAARF